MDLSGNGFENLAYLWIFSNFLIYLVVFGVALYLNFNFNTVMVGMIYLLPLIPLGLNTSNAPRFLMQSWHNTIFGIIELVIFVVTVRPADLTFDREHIRQLFGHVLPIALALVGLSFVSRASTVPVGMGELVGITVLFLSGAVLRVLAVYQLGGVGFKFDIVFREGQRLQTRKLYSLMRHPSYTAMMMVILAYAWTCHNLVAAILGLLSAWFGFQYRIHHEEQALQKQFGEEYLLYRRRTGMWFPLPWRGDQ